MKKLLSAFVLIIIVAVGCKPGGNEKSAIDPALITSKKSSAQAAAPPTDIVYEALDGTPRDEALKQIAYFYIARSGRSYTNESFFLNKDMIKTIRDLLATEQPSAGGLKTDGFRIYFGQESPESETIKLILVSTTDSIAYSTSPLEKMHHDYYGHSKAALHRAGVSLKIEPEPFSTSGVKLRELVRSPQDDFPDNSCAVIGNDGNLIVSYAKRMVQNFNGNVVETKGVWFDKERLDKMLLEADFAGVRIYIATYHNNFYGSAKYGKSTFVLTTVNKSKEDYFNCNPVSIANFIKNENGKWKPEKIEPQNNGGLCPYNCN
nr:hypothetical protein [uncultured Mucilaginibacter sp.]